MWKPEAVPLDDLRARIAAGAEAARSSFARTGDGRAEIRRRSAEVQALLGELWPRLLAGREMPVAVFALGGFGRQELFPYSDIDVLFLCASESAERDAHELIRSATQAMWDAGLRPSPATRTLKECERLDGPLEFAISLLDRRFQSGRRARGSTAAFCGATPRSPPALKASGGPDPCCARRPGSKPSWLKPRARATPGSAIPSSISSPT